NGLGRRRGGGARRRGSPGAQRARQQHVVVHHTDRGRRRQGAAGSQLPDRRTRRAGQPGTRHRPRRRNLPRHRRQPCDPRELHRHPARPLQGRPRGRRAGPAHGQRRLRRDRGSRQARRELHASRGRRSPRARRPSRRRRIGNTGEEPMSIELGHFALAVALALGLALGVLPLVGAHRRDARLMAVAQPAAIAQFLAIGFAFATLVAGFVANDFSAALIASHSNNALPLELRIAASWGSHEGSMLLWSLMLSGWTCAVAAFSRSLSPVLRARILGILGLVSVGFLLFLLFTSNPFERLLPPATEGRDLNPLLQDPGMVFHPPLLYMGYVGLSVAFAFAVAGLIGGRFDAAWARWARPWTTVAWCFLTLGIALGSFWAYYE